MKILNLMFVCLAVSTSLCVNAQTKITVKSGTPIELRPVTTTYARNVEVGDNLKFQVVSDVSVNGKTVISRGMIADGVVTEAKKSSLCGTKGRLSVDFKYLILGDGSKVPLTGTVRVTGKNRTPLAIITGCFLWPCIFIPGTKAVLTESYTSTATVLTNTEIVIAE